MEKLKQSDLIPSTTTTGFKPGRYYSGNTLADRLESYLMEKKISWIGQEDKWRLQLEIKEGQNKGSVRSASLEMNPVSRAYRTKDIIQLSEEGLMLLHQWEQGRMMRFVIGPTEIRGTLRLSSNDLPDQTPLSPTELETYQSLNEKSRPELMKYDGFLIPPYFVYDNNFDGMNYHHAIDRNAWNIKNRPETS